MATSVLLIVLADLLVTGCSSASTRAGVTSPGPLSSQGRHEKEILAAAKGLTVAEARTLLRSKGWTARVEGTRARSIDRSDEGNWQVVDVESSGTTATLIAGKLRIKTRTILYTTKRVKLDDKPDTYRSVRPGVPGKVKITYLDGRKIKSSIVRKPVAKIIRTGTVHVYTGRCTIVGPYAHRSVECTGDYDPRAKSDAWELADRCNSTTEPLADCRGVHGSHFQ